jgi:hypothetical protein
METSLHTLIANPHLRVGLFVLGAALVGLSHEDHEWWKFAGLALLVGTHWLF